MGRVTVLLETEIRHLRKKLAAAEKVCEAAHGVRGAMETFGKVVYTTPQALELWSALDEWYPV